MWARRIWFVLHKNLTVRSYWGYIHGLSFNFDYFMDQRTSVILAAVLFAVVVAASVAYLIYGTPATSPTASPTPTPTEQAQATATPTAFAFVSPTPFPTLAALPLSATHNVPSPKPTSVKATAKTGPEDWALVAMFMAPLLGAAGLFKVARD
jgi:hypothetical protein